MLKSFLGKGMPPLSLMLLRAGPENGDGGGEKTQFAGVQEEHRESSSVEKGSSGWSMISGRKRR